jgi:hypothetical protein
MSESAAAFRALRPLLTDAGAPGGTLAADDA